MSETRNRDPKDIVTYILGSTGWKGVESGAMAKIPGVEDYVFPTKVRLMPDADTLHLEYNYLGKKRRTSKFKLSNITHLQFHAFNGEITLYFVVNGMNIGTYNYEYKYWLRVYV